MELLANPPSSAVQAACKGNGSTGTESAKYDGYHSRSSFLSNPLSSMQSLKPLDHNDLQADMQHQMLQRRHKIKETIASMYALVNELETIMDQFVSKQDELILSTCGQELEAIGSMECEQELLRVQMIRFIKATSSSFEEIFRQSPTPP